jgi:hypothetical protein
LNGNTGTVTLSNIDLKQTVPLSGIPTLVIPMKYVTSVVTKENFLDALGTKLVGLE